MSERTIKQSDIRPKFSSSINYLDREKLYTDPGVEEEDVFVMKINEITREEELVPTGQKRNLVDLHQADFESVDINTLMKRYQVGDMNAIMQIENVFFGDSTTMPLDSLEAANKILASRQMFDNLPLEVKQSFDNNYLKWMDKVDKLDPDTLIKSGLAYMISTPSEVKESVGDSE